MSPAIRLNLAILFNTILSETETFKRNWIDTIALDMMAATGQGMKLYGPSFEHLFKCTIRCQSCELQKVIQYALTKVRNAIFNLLFSNEKALDNLDLMLQTITCISKDLQN